ARWHRHLGGGAPGHQLLAEKFLELHRFDHPGQAAVFPLVVDDVADDEVRHLAGDIRLHHIEHSVVTVEATHQNGGRITIAPPSAHRRVACAEEQPIATAIDPKLNAGELGIL